MLSKSSPLCPPPPLQVAPRACIANVPPLLPPPPQVRAQDMQIQRYKVLECYALMAGKIQVGGLQGVGG